MVQATVTHVCCTRVAAVPKSRKRASRVKGAAIVRPANWFTGPLGVKKPFLPFGGGGGGGGGDGGDGGGGGPGGGGLEVPLHDVHVSATEISGPHDLVNV